MTPSSPGLKSACSLMLTTRSGPASLPAALSLCTVARAYPAVVPVLLDTTPLRVNPSYRRLFTGFTLSGIGAQLAVVAIGLQVYAISGTSFAVGLVGLFALVPLVVMGLYGGALVDAHDRRTVALVSGLVGWAVSIANAAYAWLGQPTLWWLYLVVALQSAAFGVISPARSSIYPRLLDLSMLPAANALNVFATNLYLTVGPLLAGLLVDAGGYRLAYTFDAALFSFAMWGLVRLEPIPPQADPSLDQSDPGAAPPRGRPAAGPARPWPPPPPPGPARRAGRPALPGHPPQRADDLPGGLLRDDPGPAAGAVPGGGRARVRRRRADGRADVGSRGGRLGPRDALLRPPRRGRPPGPGRRGGRGALGRLHHRLRRRRGGCRLAGRPGNGAAGRCGLPGLRRGGGLGQLGLPQHDPAVSHPRPPARTAPGRLHRG